MPHGEIAWEPVTHLAGLPVNIRGRLVQRCALCGALLRDNIDEVAPEDPEGNPASAVAWPMNALIHSEGQATWVVPGRPDTLPADCCLNRVDVRAAAASDSN